MTIERRPLAFDHVLKHRTEQRKIGWQETLGLVGSFVLDKRVYKKGLVFLALKSEEGLTGDCCNSENRSLDTGGTRSK